MKNNKVCHLTSAHSRYDVRIFSKECVSLAQNGYDVTLVVNDDKEDEIINNVKIVSTRFKAKNRLDRILNSKNKVWDKALEVDADIYHFHDPELIPVGNKLKKNNKKVIFDSHEDVPRQIEDKEWLPKILRKIISRIYSIYEKKSVREYDALISVTPHIVERLHCINRNTVMVTNYPIVDLGSEVRRKPSRSICFAGGISRQWNIDKIIKAIESIEDLQFVLAGNGNREYMDSIQQLPAWSKVNYVRKIPHSEVKNIYEISIAGMALNYSAQAKTVGTLGNTKIFEFMESEVPVICTNYILWKEVVEGNNCGICVDPNNIDQVKDAIEYLLNNPEHARLMGENGRKAVIEKYNWSLQEKVLFNLYSQL